MSKTSRGGATLRQIFTLIGALLGMCLIGGALIAGIIMPMVTTAGTGVNAVTAMFEESPDDLGFVEPSEQSVLLASDGSTIATFYTENRIVVASNQISKHMKNAAVSIEDRRFYDHHGIDVQGLAGAFVNNLTGGDTAGGSSITQQYVKNALIEQGRVTNDHNLIEQATERTIARKLNEARLAIAVERKMSKDQILTGYLNLAQFGPNRYGVEVSAQYFFSKSAKDLNLPESALLAGITQSPARWDPTKHPAEAKKRRDTVIGEMYRNGYISKAEMDSAKAVQIPGMLHISNKPTGCAAAKEAAYFCEYVRNDLLNDQSWGKNRNDRIAKLYHGGLTIQTTLDPKKQKIAHDTLVKHIPTNDRSNIQTAMSSIEPGSGHIVAMAQNTDYDNASDSSSRATKINLNVSRKMGGGTGFQSGSTFKVFTLVEWLKKGLTEKGKFTEQSIVDSNGGTLPRNSWNIPCSPKSRDTYSFGNLEGVGGGPRTVLYSTIKSVNGSFVRMANKLNLCDIADTAKKMGVERGDGGNWKYFPSMILGANEVTPLSMASAVSTLAADGLHCKPQSFTKVSDSNGKVLASKDPECDQVLDKELARKTTSVLKQVVGSPEGTGKNAQVPGREVAGKTGTANDDTNAWFMGYTPQLASAVWQGHMSRTKSMFNSTINGKQYREVYGGLFPSMIFSDYTKAALEGQPSKSLGGDKKNNSSSPSSSPSKSPEATPSTSTASPSNGNEDGQNGVTPSQDQPKHKDEDSDENGGEGDDGDD